MPGLRLQPTPSVAELEHAGLLVAGTACEVSAFAVFRPCDDLGRSRPIVLGDGVSVGDFAVVHGGTELGDRARVEDHVIVGQPERGYAVRQTYEGAGAPTIVGPEVVLRAGAVLYAGVTVGPGTVIGHHTLLRSNVQVGRDTQIGHHLTVERGVQIGDRVRCSPGSHITSETQLADEVFLGAGIRTINDNGLVWSLGGGEAELVPPRFERGCRVGSGSTLLGGVVIGERALVGAGSVVTHDVPAESVAYGNPAVVRGHHQPEASS